MDAVAFLNHLLPDGPWLLHAIRTDRKGIETDVFGPETEADARAWIARRNGKANLYFLVNLPRPGLAKKACIEDIEALRCLHVDIDARAGEPLPEELTRIKSLLTDGLPQGVPPPTAIVFSGGGYQAFWRLAEPVRVDDNAKPLARYNKQLKLLLGGDSCHNIDRIMRLPGTMNVPDATKIARGRVPVEAEVYDCQPTLIYPLSDFTPASGPTTAFTPPAVARRLGSVDDLDRWNVPERIKVIIVQGFHPDETKEGDNSRSGWLFHAMRELVRCEVPDEVIYSIITDPGFAISRHVLEQKGDTSAYAARQIERAKQAAQDYERTASKAIKPTVRNVFVALARHGDEFTYDEMLQCERINGERATDELVNALWGDIATRDNWNVPQSLLREAVLYLAQQRRFHPVRDYLDGLTWDGTARVERWTVAYLGAEDTAYHRHVGRVLLLGAVRRVRRPGCKFDTMVVLEGPQGAGKSSALRILAVKPEWFTDHLPLDENKVRLAEALQGNWIVEASELEGLRKADVAKLKTFLSSQEDKVRMAYAHKVSLLPRQCVIVGTTNDERYLRDDTGNRRYYPLKTGRIDLAGLREVRDKLWAEAAHLEAQPGARVILPAALWTEAEQHQQRRMERPPCYDELEQRLYGYDDHWIAVADVRAVLGARPLDWHSDWHMGRAMKMLGWEKFDKRQGGGLIKAYGIGGRTTKLEHRQQWDAARGDHEHRLEPPPPAAQKVLPV